jgi:hypothetical protein
MKLNSYLPFAFIYFFLNSLGLPFGLTYTALLAPLFYIWILRKRQTEVLLPFLAMLTPFVLIHFLTVNPDQKAYLVSLLNIVLVYIFGQAVYTFLKVCENIEKIFRALLIINFFLCIIAAIVYFTPFDSVFWVNQEITEGVKEFKRMRMFTYEPSYYATLFVPVFFFFLLQYLFQQNKIRGIYLLMMLFFPYALSFSIGVIACIVIAMLGTLTFHFLKLVRRKRVFNSILNFSLFAGTVSAIAALFFRTNIFFVRLSNVSEGKDMSGKGRTSEAFVLAGKILDQTNKYWGAGIGQVKIAGAGIIRDFYMYSPYYPVAIPNATAETWAIFGWIGIVARFAVEIFLFFCTRVWSNYYRLLLFFFIFSYQFTGSFITSSGEYVIWILAFTNVFEQFNITRRTSQD